MRLTLAPEPLSFEVAPAAVRTFRDGDIGPGCSAVREGIGFETKGGRGARRAGRRHLAGSVRRRRLRKSREGVHARDPIFLELVQKG